MDEYFVPIMAGLWLAWMVSWHVAAIWRGAKREEAPRREYRLHFLIAIIGFALTFTAWLELQEDNGPGTPINRYMRYGRIELDGERVEIRSVHHLAGTSMPTSTPIGYVFEQRGHAVGAVELNGRPALMIEPGASPALQRTLTLAALALGVFWDPANTGA